MILRTLGLFAGIGGLELGLSMAGPFTPVAFCEQNLYARAVLAKNYPGVPQYDDVRTLTGDTLAADGIGRIDVLTGGFPCQPHSTGGKRLASLDERDLWPDFARILGETRPRWMVAENVRGLLSSRDPAHGRRHRGGFFGRVLRDLADLGFNAEWHCYEAAAIGAPHLRDRVFLVAYATSPDRWRDRPGADLADAERFRRGGGSQHHDRTGLGESRNESQRGRSTVGECPAWMGGAWEQPWPLVGRPESRTGGVADGVPTRVDKLRAYGNAVVPRQAAVIGRAIAEAEGHLSRFGVMPERIVQPRHLRGAQ